MISSPDFADPVLKLPVVSLYGPRLDAAARGPGGDVEVLLVDLMDVGTRVYTFAATLAKVMEAAGRRWARRWWCWTAPTPSAASAVEGNLLRPEWASLVGPYPLPMRHGFTLGELARYYNRHPGARLRPRGDPRGGLAAGRLFRRHRPALGAALPQPAHPGGGHGLSRPGPPGGHQPLGRPGHHPALRAVRRPLSGARAHPGADFADIELPGVILREACFRAHLPQVGRGALPGLSAPRHRPAGLQALLHHPGPAVGHPGALPRAVRLAPAALRIRDRAPAH